MSLYEPEPDLKRVVFLLFLAFFITGFIYEAFNEHGAVMKGFAMLMLLFAVIMIFLVPSSGMALPLKAASDPAGYLSGTLCFRLLLKDQ